MMLHPVSVPPRQLHAPPCKATIRNSSGRNEGARRAPRDHCRPFLSVNIPASFRSPSATQNVYCSAKHQVRGGVEEAGKRLGFAYQRFVGDPQEIISYIYIWRQKTPADKHPWQRNGGKESLVGLAEEGDRRPGTFNIWLNPTSKYFGWTRGIIAWSSRLLLGDDDFSLLFNCCY